jgi:hypothetical protein
MMTRYQNPPNTPAAPRTARPASDRTASHAERPDLSGSFAVTLIAGLTSAGLFFAAALRQELPLEQVVTHPFGLMALVLLAGAAVMTRVGEV